MRFTMAESGIKDFKTFGSLSMCEKGKSFLATIAQSASFNLLVWNLRDCSFLTLLDKAAATSHAAIWLFNIPTCFYEKPSNGRFLRSDKRQIAGF